MTICNYYRGGTDRISGFVYNTDNKTFKSFIFSASKWLNEDGTYKFGFKTPGDIKYFFQTLRLLNDTLSELQYIGFKEDNNMPLDFGIFTL